MIDKLRAEILGCSKKRTELGVSIIIPVYNSSKTIAQTLLSALIFKPRGCEILVYLDGDLTTSKFMDYAANRGWINVYKGKNRLGIAHALNFLISKSKKPVVARLDDDDLALPFYISRALKKIRTSKVDIVFSNAIYFGKSLGWVPLLPQLPYGIATEHVAKFLSLGNPFVHPTMVASKEAILRVGGYKDTPAEDYELWIRSVLSGLSLCRIRGFGVLYRVHPGQFTATPNYRHLVETDKNISYQLNKLILKLGYTASNNDLATVKENISRELENSIWGYRMDLAFRKLIEGAKRIRFRVGKKA
jgi:glycosyltransferase involved in cell wall biosynthesis